MTTMVRLGKAKRRGDRLRLALMLAIVSVFWCTALSGPARAAMINTEAAPPQRSKAPVTSSARAGTPNVDSSASTAGPTARTERDRPERQLSPRLGDGIPDQSWGGALVAPRQTTAKKTASRQNPAPSPIQEPKSRPAAKAMPEPDKASNVRPNDVAPFQKIGSPYQVLGTWYVPAHEPNYDETGVASWYGEQFHGRPTANGEIFDMGLVSGAHPTLPIPSMVEVTNLANGRSLMVRINDRGPFVGGRLIDMSARGAQLLGFKEQGHTQVRVRYVGPASEAPLTFAETQSTEPVAARSSEAAPVDGVSFVQMGAFSSRANAERLRDQSMSRGRVLIKETPQPDGRPLYRVMLGSASGTTHANTKTPDPSSEGISGGRVLASLN